MGYDLCKTCKDCKISISANKCGGGQHLLSQVFNEDNPWGIQRKGIGRYIRQRAPFMLCAVIFSNILCCPASYQKLTMGVADHLFTKI